MVSSGAGFCPSTVCGCFRCLGLLFFLGGGRGGGHVAWFLLCLFCSFSVGRVRQNPNKCCLFWVCLPEQHGKLTHPPLQVELVIRLLRPDACGEALEVLTLVLPVQRLGFPLPHLGPPARCPFTNFFGWEVSPTKIDRKTSWYPCSNLTRPLTQTVGP